MTTDFFSPKSGGFNAESDANASMQAARESLAELGLAFRIKDGQQIDADTWRELDRLARRIIECVTFQEPTRTGPVYPWLCIDKLRGNPNSSGYVVEFKAPELVYWLPKADFERLRELEYRLDDLAATAG